MLAAPDLRETMEQAMRSPRSRPTLENAYRCCAESSWRSPECAADATGRAALSARASGELAAELRIEKAYSALSVSTSRGRERAGRAWRSPRRAGPFRTRAQGRRSARPEAAAEYLRSARRAGLAAGGSGARSRGARDAWAMRLDAFSVYRRAIERSVQELRDATEVARPDPRAHGARRRCCCRGWSSAW